MLNLTPEMKTFNVILITTVSVLILGLTIFFLIGYFKPKPGGILIDTNPGSSVYVDGNYVGKTPFQGVYDAETITLKLVPEISDKNLLPYETRITLVSGVQTVVRREFGITEELSSGDVISFDKASRGETGLVVISTPDNAQISVDGVARGFAPYKTSTITPAEHQLTIKALGYADRTITVKTLTKYRLTVFAKLAKAEAESAETQGVSTTQSTQQSKTYVEILQTPTGFLRVRTEPGTKGAEIAEVKPGTTYLFLDEDIETGWFKIQYEEAKPGLPNGIVGWVSNQFAKKIDQESVATPSATTTP